MASHSFNRQKKVSGSIPSHANTFPVLVKCAHVDVCANLVDFAQLRCWRNGLPFNATTPARNPEWLFHSIPHQNLIFRWLTLMHLCISLIKVKQHWVALVLGWVTARERVIKCRENCEKYRGHQPELTTLWALCGSSVIRASSMTEEHPGLNPQPCQHFSSIG